VALLALAHLLLGQLPLGDVDMRAHQAGGTPTRVANDTGARGVTISEPPSEVPLVRDRPRESVASRAVGARVPASAALGHTRASLVIA
jgi:hypothetical protein